MSDPHKNFICKARKHIINDMLRKNGRDSDCFYCQMEERKYPIKNIVDFYELYIKDNYDKIF